MTGRIKRATGSTNALFSVQVHTGRTSGRTAAAASGAMHPPFGDKSLGVKVGLLVFFARGLPTVSAGWRGGIGF